MHYTRTLIAPVRTTDTTTVWVWVMTTATLSAWIKHATARLSSPEASFNLLDRLKRLTGIIDDEVVCFDDIALPNWRLERQPMIDITTLPVSRLHNDTADCILHEVDLRAVKLSDAPLIIYTYPITNGELEWFGARIVQPQEQPS